MKGTNTNTLLDTTFMSTIEDSWPNLASKFLKIKHQRQTTTNFICDSQNRAHRCKHHHTYSQSHRFIIRPTNSIYQRFSVQTKGSDRTDILQKLEARHCISSAINRAIISAEWADIDKQNLPWETDLAKLKLRFYSFDGCYLNYLADVIETEFPGTLSLSLIKEAASKTEFMLMTTAKTQFLSKWLRTLLIEEGFLQKENYTLKSKQRFIDIRLHPNSSLAGSYC